MSIIFKCSRGAILASEGFPLMLKNSSNTDPLLLQLSFVLSWTEIFLNTVLQWMRREGADLLNVGMALYDFITKISHPVLKNFFLLWKQVIAKRKKI